MSRPLRIGPRAAIGNPGLKARPPVWGMVKLWAAGLYRPRTSAKLEVVLPSGAQVEVGRMLLGWTTETLAARAKVSPQAVERAARYHQARLVEDGELAAIGMALETAGIEFVRDPDAGAGVRLSRGTIPHRRDQRSVFERVVDDSDLLFVLLYALGWEPSDYLLGNRWPRFPG